MIAWGEKKRQLDPGFFCRAAIKASVAHHSQGLQNTSYPEVSKYIYIYIEMKKAVCLYRNFTINDVHFGFIYHFMFIHIFLILFLLIFLILLTILLSWKKTKKKLYSPLLKTWIVSDARRISDIQFFKTHYKEQVVTIRVQASEATRIARGYTFTPGVDDAESECGLDNEQFDIYIDNDNLDANGVLLALQDSLKHPTAQ